MEGGAALRTRIDAKQDELSAGRALTGRREQLAQALARRTELIRQLSTDNGDGEGSAAKLGQPVGDLGEPIKRADAEADRRDKALLAPAPPAPPKETAPGTSVAQRAPNPPHAPRPRPVRRAPPPRHLTTP